MPDMKQNLKYLMLVLLLGLGCVACDSSDDEDDGPVMTNEEIDRAALKDLDAKFASQWTAAERQQANSAASASYLSASEKELFYYLNLMRLNPASFAETYAKAYTGDRGWTNGYAFDERKASLLAELAALAPLPVLQPSEELYDAADCYATSAGPLGLTGHDRTATGCAENPGLAECCDFGSCYSGYAIVMHLLIDAGETNAGLGHRRILLNDLYTRMGVAIRPHATYQRMAVLDFSNR